MRRIILFVSLALVGCSEVVVNDDGGAGGSGDGGAGSAALECTRVCVEAHTGSGAGEEACGCEVSP